MLILTIKTHGQIGFLGKRNVISTDIFNTFFQKKYNLNYNFCIGKGLMLKAAYSLHRYSNTIFLTKENNYYTGNNEVADVSLRGHSWELGFDFGNFLQTNMPMPIGYFMGIAFEHFSGTLNENRTYNNLYAPPTEKKYIFNNKANIFKLIYGRNSYIKYNFIIKTSVDIGMYLGSVIENDPANSEECPLMVLPLSNPKVFRIKYNSNYDKMKKVTFYVMPNISLGYIF